MFDVMACSVQSVITFFLSERAGTFITILETLSAVKRKIKVLWDVMLCSLVST